MAPIRRYLRITKYSVIEVRIYLDNPAWAESWLLRKNDPALPRIIAAIRPDVLPKLREENERAQRGGKKAGKKQGAIRDKVKGDDFEVSLFYTNQTTPHSLLTKHKSFTDKPRLRSNSSKLTSWLNDGTSEKPIILQNEDAIPAENPIVLREEDDEDTIKLMDIPPMQIGQDDESLFVDENEVTPDPSPPSNRLRQRRDRAPPINVNSEDDETEHAGESKKKLVLSTRYEGFSIYGRTLCLMVRRTGPGATRVSDNRSGASSSQQMMETWVSTQAQREEEGLVGLVDG